jgi:hypothetical protein
MTAAKQSCTSPVFQNKNVATPFLSLLTAVGGFSV